MHLHAEPVQVLVTKQHSMLQAQRVVGLWVKEQACQLRSYVASHGDVQCNLKRLQTLSITRTGDQTPSCIWLTHCAAT